MAEGILSASGIYAIVNKVNGKKYVGSSISISRRFADHKRDLGKGKHHCQPMQRAWVKYGADSFDFVVLEFVCEHALLLRREQYWIDKTGAADDLGYNVCRTAGNRLGTKLPAAAIEKMRASKRGKMNDIEAMRKCWQSNVGRKHSDEVRAKISAGRKGLVVSAETRAKQSVVRTGKKQSEQSRQKKSLALKGRPRPPEVVAQIVATRMRRKLERLAIAIDLQAP